jgi:uncharacterized membrane protein
MAARQQSCEEIKMSAAQIAESRQLARAKHFPPGSEDQDELPNHLIVRIS